MFWADKIAKEIIHSGNYLPYWVDDMKTPSGRVHVGSLRGVVIHDLVYKALRDQGKEATFTYVFEDHDPMDGMPHYLDKNEWDKYMGQPLFTIPSPDGKAKSFAHYFAEEFQRVFNKVGCTPKILWTGDLYREGKMNEDIKLCLDKVVVIRSIYETTYKKKLPDTWYPFQVMCPNCKKESTTKVTAWDGEEVTFTCVVDAVDWTRGCGHQGTISPFSNDGNYVGKLTWKVEWPVKWKVIGVTVEGAGKDHMSAGGSHDIAKQICEKVLDYPVPYPVAYEFFLIGGKKMSSSKGLGSSSKEVSEVLPPYLLRFLFTRTDYNQAIDFDPVGNMYIPDLYDEYDRCWQAYNHQENEDLSRIFELSQANGFPEKIKNLFIPRFRDVANFMQLPNIKIVEKFEEMKGAQLTDFEKEILEERITYAYVWLSKYAPDTYRYQVSEKKLNEIKITNEQWDFLNELSKIWQVVVDPEILQSELFKLAEKKNLDTKSAFKALYIVVLDKQYGPRAGWLRKKFPVEDIVARLTLNLQNNESNEKASVTHIKKPDFFHIDGEITQKYPTISVGIALIKGVEISKTDSKLEREKQQLLEEFSDLTTEQLGKYPEVVSYRKLYKEMGVDWHSRRPSPEALLRRVALKKGLYSVNTCVDAYNIVVMKHRISIGAFDANQVKFPTVLRFGKTGEKILLLGDAESTEYTEKELAYFDTDGGYNIDFNYRDAQRTKVTEKTKNIWINVDGVYDITSEQVQKSLDESVEMIMKHCGGKLDFKGIIK